MQYDKNPMHLVILDGNNTIHVFQPFLSLSKNTTRLTPKLSTSPMVDSPSGRVPVKAPRWDLADTEGCDGGIRYSWSVPMVPGYIGIYRMQ